MKKNIAVYRFLLAGMALLLAFTAYQVQAQSDGGSTARGVSTAPRADIVAINRLGDGFETLEKEAVIFLHDQHTTILGKDAKDCTVCHGTTERGYFDWNQLGSTGLSGEALRDAYHLACVSCHQTRNAAGSSAGPIDREGNCISCHREIAPESIAMQVRMPLSLHAVHNNSALIPPPEGEEQNCAVCHHTVVDPESNALILERGKEQACFTCHKAEKENNTPALDVAAHQTCLTCHVALTLDNKNTGPTNCSTCHAVPLVLERKYLDIRMERDQPDTTFVFPQSAPGEPLPTTVMPPAVFNHALHEGITDQCSSCHHQRIDTCGKCHTVLGEANGDYISLYQTSHIDDPRAVVRLAQNPRGNALWAPGQTCIGCHQTTALSVPECMGCHSSVTAVEKTAANCNICHVPVGDNPGSRQTVLQLAQLPADYRAELAVQAAQQRTETITRVDFADLAENVSIGLLSDEYMPVDFPHAKIVRTLLNPARDSRLAATFHQGDILACANCHHNSTASMNPPSCASCHPQSLEQADKLGRPTLKIAYHQRCMSCHTTMQVVSPANADCKSCHQERILYADGQR